MINFDDWFARHMPDAGARAGQYAAQPVTGQAAVLPGIGTVRKLSAVASVPEELLMDAGVIPDTRPALPPPSWRARLRRKRDAWRERAARRAFRAIAGHEVPDGEDW